MASGRAHCALAAIACFLCWCLLGLASSFVANPLAGSHEAARLPVAGTLPAGEQLRGGSAPAATDILAASATALAGALLAVGLSARRAAAGPARCLVTPCAAKKGKKAGGKKGKGGGGSPAADENEPFAAEEELVPVDTQELLDDWQSKIEASKDVLRESFVGIRAGKAAPQLLDSIKVSAYDSEMSIKEVGSITVQDTKTLLITCFDEAVAPAVEKAMMMSGLGYSAVVAGANITIGIPELTKDKRQQYVKLAKDAAEKSKTAVRNVRQAAMKKVKSLKDRLSDDESRGLQKQIEDMVKKEVGELDSMFKKKEEELSSV